MVAFGCAIHSLGLDSCEMVGVFSDLLGWIDHVFHVYPGGGVCDFLNRIRFTNLFFGYRDFFKAFVKIRVLA